MIAIKTPPRLFLVIAAPVAIGAVLLAMGFGLGAVIFSGTDDGPSSATMASMDESPSAPTMYTCSMHPQVRLPDPDAKCPICFMDLIPVEDSAGGSDTAPILTMSPAAMSLASIEVVPVRRALPQIEVRMVGKLDYDETRLATISAYIPGRLDKLYVDFTGVPVSAGDHLVSIYSPELSSAEAELLSNLESFASLDGRSSETTRSIAAASVRASREKLRLWGLTSEQISDVERTKQISDHMTIYAPIGGVVTRKHKVEGEYVNTGEPIYSVADLSRLWLRLDAYESDLRWLRYGQDLEFSTEAFPGEMFHGTIAFIDPHVSPDTRTVTLRVNVSNDNGRLKPGMFVRATVRPVIAGEGEVVATDLAGKLVCPMHPEVVEDTQVPCSLCGMDLVPAEDLGYVSMANGHDPPLLIPATAPLLTGKRAIVYVQLTDREQPTFEGREITLGPRAGDVYIVHDDGSGDPGLAEGDLVVVRGNFKIDSALQIQARRSMMSPDDEVPGTAPATAPPMIEEPAIASIAAPIDFMTAIGPVYDEYLRMQEGLAGDRLNVAIDAAHGLHDALDAVDATALDADAMPVWDDLVNRLTEQREHVDHLDDIEQMRALFETYSLAMIEFGRHFGYAGEEEVVIAYCPMAFDFKGASWIQAGDEINNPYFGAEMLRCGEVRGPIAAAPANATDLETNHD